MEKINEDDFVLSDDDKLNLSKGERFLFKYILYFCRKYGTETVANTQEFRDQYLVVLAKNKVQQEENSVNKYFETLKNKGFLIPHPDYKRKYYKVKFDCILNDKEF
jgi:Fic family protein